MGQDDRPLSYGEFDERIPVTKAEKRRRKEKQRLKDKGNKDAKVHERALGNQR